MCTAVIFVPWQLKLTTLSLPSEIIQKKRGFLTESLHLFHFPTRLLKNHWLLKRHYRYIQNQMGYGDMAMTKLSHNLLIWQYSYLGYDIKGRQLMCFEESIETKLSLHLKSDFRY